MSEGCAPGRVLLLTTSHRLPPGLLSWPAWQALRTAAVFTAPTDRARHEPYLADAGIDLGTLDGEPAEKARRLVAAARNGDVVWIAAPDGDPGLVAALGSAREAASTREPTGTPRSAPPEIEVLHGSADPPGAHVLDLVAVMDRLRSPGGCPWDAGQTHASLVPYLLEEAYEAIESIELGDRAHLREELGDLLLQVVFHARVAEEHAAEPFSVDDVADGIVTKLINRHPHVFGDAHAEDAETVETTWEALKAAEKGRDSAVDGVPTGQPALALAAKLMSRAQRAGLDVAVPALDVPAEADLGDVLIGAVAAARRRGQDPEAELRAAARRYAEAVRAAEAARGGRGR